MKNLGGRSTLPWLTWVVLVVAADAALAGPFRSLGRRRVATSTPARSISDPGNIRTAGIDYEYLLANPESRAVSLRLALGDGPCARRWAWRWR